MHGPRCPPSSARLGRILLAVENPTELSLQRFAGILGHRLRVDRGELLAQLSWYCGGDLFLRFSAELSGHLAGVQLQEGLELGRKRTGLRRFGGEGADDDHRDVLDRRAVPRAVAAAD